jgi:membrane protein DedA with SNARE-associated domain
MADLINRITMLAERLLLTVGYPGIFLVVFIENFFGPLPSPPVLPLGGIMAARGTLNFFGVWMAAVMGALAGALALYAVGRWADERLVRRMIRRYGPWLRLSEERLDWALGRFRRYGVGVIIVGRLFPVSRNLVSLTAGMSRLPVPKFLLATAAISTPSIGIWVYGGYALGENWPQVLGFIARFEVLILLTIGAAGIIGLALLFRRLRRGQGSTPASITP